MQHTFFCTNKYNSFSPVYFETLVSKYFTLKEYSRDQNVSGCSIVINVPYRDAIKQLSKQSLDQCKYIIVDNLQECFYYGLDELTPWADKVILLTGGKHQLHSWKKVINIPEWFWYYESMWYTSLGYNEYIPSVKSNPKLFLMPIRRIKRGRDLIYSNLKPMLDNAIWSYVERGFDLPGYPDNDKDNQRYFNPAWYNDTMFSVVNEDSDDNEPLIWTEKTCKPIAFYHPFILVAQQGVLKMVQDAGFQTFPELFDESYDQIPALTDRVNFVSAQIKQFDPSNLSNPIVVEKLLYNHNYFFNTDLVTQNLIERLFNPLLEYLNA